MKQLAIMLFLATALNATIVANTKSRERYDNLKEELPVQLVTTNGTTSVKVDALTQTLINLGRDYKSELRGIKLSRIAPEQQNQKITELNRKYSDLRSEATRATNPISLTSVESIPEHLILSISDEGVIHEVEPVSLDSLFELGTKVEPIIYEGDTKEILDSLDLQFQEDMQQVEDSISDPDEQDNRLKELADKFEYTKNKIIAEHTDSLPAIEKEDTFHDFRALVSQTLNNANLDANKSYDLEELTIPKPEVALHVLKENIALNKK